MKHPSEIEWIEGDLPDVHTVPKDCCVLAFIVCNVTMEEYEQCKPHCSHPNDNGRLLRIRMCHPWENDLNPLRWCDSSMPIGYHEKVAHWAWLNKGTPDEEASAI